MDVDGNGGRSHGGIDIQINGGDEEEEEEEVEEEDDDDDDYDEEGEGGEGDGCATNDVEKAICIAATAGDKKGSILTRLRWMSGGGIGGGSGDAKVRFLQTRSIFTEK